MVGAGAVHHFPNLEFLRRMLRIQEERLTQPDMVGPVGEDESELQGTGLNDRELSVGREIEAIDPRVPWRCA